MRLPELSFAPAQLYGNELFLGPNRELTRVLAQGNPVYLNLLLPGTTRPTVRIGFPEVGTTWVYADASNPKEGLVGQFTEGGGQPFNTEIKYRYGMELTPWMFFCWLGQELALQRSRQHNIVNYIVPNCSSGHAGILIRILRGADRAEIAREWMEIYRFSTGNDFCFHARWREDPNTQLIARYVPESAGTAELRWVPERISQ